MLSRYLLLFCSLLPGVIWAEVVDIDIKELQTMNSSGDIVVIDVRTPKEWQQTGIVKGSIPIMFFDEKRKAHAREWMNQASAHITPENEVILICRSGNRSKTIANYLSQQHGYKRVYNVKGGIKQWLRFGNKTVAPE